MKIVLYNIRSSWNVGAIFRSCDATDCDLILVGYTARPNSTTLKLIHKTAIGAENYVNWEYYEHPRKVFELYSDHQHYAIEISDKSEDVFEFLKTAKLNLNKTILWLGNEIHGLPEEVISSTSKELHLPMLGKKESLNVASTACTIAYLFRFSDKNFNS